jgi:ribosomal protein RSM22 (predicted rRNA methylase)
MTLPDVIAGAVAKWIAAHGQGSLRQASGKLTQAYRVGNTSVRADLATYLTVRAPATFAAVSNALAATAKALPDFAPRSCLDAGCGPGTATWAAHQTWPTLTTATLADADNRFLNLARALAPENTWTFLQANIADPSLPRADLVIASYVLSELTSEAAAHAAAQLWSRTQSVLIIVEPGTPRGFERIRLARTALLAAGANIAAPCTHHAACPMQKDNWCHFSVRLARSRMHMHAKAAGLPFEDEPFSYLAVSRIPANLGTGRILHDPAKSKSGIAFDLCTEKGLRELVVARRDKQSYRSVRKLRRGGVLPS